MVVMHDPGCTSECLNGCADMGVEQRHSQSVLTLTHHAKGTTSKDKVTAAERRRPRARIGVQGGDRVPDSDAQPEGW